MIFLIPRSGIQPLIPYIYFTCSLFINLLLLTSSYCAERIRFGIPIKPGLWKKQSAVMTKIFEVVKYNK